jgi:signal transduction histidine kinase
MGVIVQLSTLRMDQSHADFLGDGGEMGVLMRAYDWSASPVGPPIDWPPSLRIAIRLMLNTRHPVHLMWGKTGICFYNDAFAPSMGAERHPKSLGKPAREVWAEVWPLIGSQIEQVFAGRGAVWHENALVPFTRNGKREDIYWTYSYSPIDEPTAPNGVGGVLVICTETTGQVLSAQHAAAEIERQRQHFQQMPGFVAILSGPTHIFQYVNDAYIAVAGQRDFLGRAVHHVFPELEGQAFFGLLDRVYTTGKDFSARAMPVRLAGEIHDRFIDLLYSAIRDAEGQITGIFVGGYEITERVRAERRQTLLYALMWEQRHADDEQSILASAANVVGRSLNSDLTGFILPNESGMPEFQAGWSAGQSPVLSGPLAVAHAEQVLRADMRWVAEDTRRESADTGRPYLGLSAAIEVPIIRAGAWQGAFYAYQATPRVWRDEEVALVDEIAQVTFDAVERLRSRNSLKDANERLHQRIVERTAERNLLADIVASTDVMIMACARDYTILAINKATAAEFARVFGMRPVVGDNMLALLADQPELQAEVERSWQRGLAGEEFTFVEHFGDPSRARPCYEITFRTLRDAEGRQIGCYQFVTDVTERLRQQSELAEAQEALRQAQKMEAVGQLTGGLAHDFNNLLTGISGSLELLSARLAQGRTGEVERYVLAAQQAAKRAASLTHRLLAFSRRQTLDPRLVNLNRLVGDLEELIRRTLGPQIHVEPLIAAAGLWTARVDPGQLENALLNLCINARDAMPNGGKLTIETGNTWFDERVAAERGLKAGQYVKLCVSDTGTGMTPEVMSRAFDPFFTTKPIGMGTGLGLSMIHGFMKQSGGHVRIYSEVGKGTMVCLYLPRDLADAPDSEKVRGGPPLIRADREEVVLVVDDEPTVRMLVTETLRDLGFASEEARDGAEGLAILQTAARLDLLITDVGLPGGLNGRQMADAARVLRPQLKILFITGYAENAVLSHGHLAHGMHILTKPFAMDELARRIQSIMLDA